MSRKINRTWIDADGYTRSKWEEMTREEEKAADVADSLERQKDLIFGYTWEQIQAKQRGKA